MAFVAPALLACALALTACASSEPSVDPSAVELATASGDVLLVDQAEFDRLRSSGTYVVSDPLGEVGAAAPCEAGDADPACVDAARQRLKDAASRRGANLVLVLNEATLQSYPPQYQLNGRLYRIRPQQ